MAALLDEYSTGSQGRPLSRMMLRRLLHSAFRVGGPENAARLLRVAANQALDENERLEALRLLSVWTSPPEVDQSLGRYAPLGKRDLSGIKRTLEREIVPLLSRKGRILAAAIGLVTRYDLSIEGLDPAGLATLLEVEDLGGEARSKALELLVKHDPDNIGETLTRFADDKDSRLASRALELLVEKAPEAALAAARSAITSGQTDRAQRAWMVAADLPGDEAASLVESGLRDLMAGTLDPAVALEVVEAAGKREEKKVRDAMQEYLGSLPADDPLAAYRVTLAGGNVERGHGIFHTHPAAQCLRCHRIDQGHSEGGEAGPNLAGIGKRHDAEYLLESLIEPNAEVAPGFGVVSLTFANGATKSGVLVSETEETLDLLEGSDLWQVRKLDIKERSKPVSAMAPPMGAVLRKREIRDLVAWLVSLREGAPPEPPQRKAKPLDPATLPVAVAQANPQPSESAPPKSARVRRLDTPAPAAEAREPVSAPTTEIDPAVMEAGKNAFILCIGCHGPEGQGMPAVGPPLAGSEWVNGPPEN
ncbi:MAG: c-type cytochrome, partial [Akkermansiaceae bacterium]|nr:c-type cytochrome [Akkermansiaceae bacterium]